MIRTTALACGLLLLARAQAEAVTTRTFVTSSYKNFEAGEGDGVLILSSGEVTPGPSAKRLDVAAAFVRSALVLGQRVVLGTGDDGEIWVLDGGKLRKLCQLPDAIEVTALVAAPGGNEVYAGATPGGRIFAVRLSDGQVRELAKLPAEHVWTLGWDGAKKELLVGTGSPGKIFAVDGAGKHKAIWDSGQKHVRSVVENDDGSLMVGTAPEAILFRVRRDGSGRALHDFEGEEVRALARFGGSTYVAVNAFAAQPPVVTTPAAGTTPPTRITPTTQPPSRKPPPAGKTQRPGKAAVYRMDGAGRVEQVHSISNGYFTALHVEKGGDLLAASGEGGRVYRIRPDRTVVTLFDFPERQVLAIAYDGGTRVLATGDAGAVYQVSEAPHASPTYLSEVFTTEFPARFGRLDWRGRGRVVVETRTGNTKKPDKTWSAWERIKVAGEDRGGAVVSPEGRYFQYRLKLAPGAAVREVVAHYHAQNQPPRVVEFTAAPTPGGPTAGAATAVTLGGRDRQSQLRLSWRVENPDSDNLTYRVYFREEEEKNWRPLGGPEPLTKTELVWNTEGVPDGHYVVRVVASDETSNPIGEALTHELTSEPFLVDNRSPEIQGLKVSFTDGGTPTVSGQARDSFSRISEIAYSVDGGDWHLVAPSDGLYDERSEAFSFRASEKLAPGAHTIAIRAADSVGNLGATAAQFRTK